MLGLLAFFTLIAVNAFFVADEFALVALDPVKVGQLAADGSRTAQRVQRLRDRLSFHLSAAQLGITISSLALGFVAEPTVARLLEPLLERLFGASSAAGLSILLALALATFFQVLLGEIVPKFLAIARPERVAMLLSRAIAAWGVLVKPFVALLNGSANAIVRWLGIEPREHLDHTPSLDELRAMIESSAKEGTLDAEDFDLLTRSIRFSEKNAADALVPRVEIESLSAQATVADLVDRSLRSGFSRFPVVGESLDDVRGVVHVKSVYSLPIAARDTTPVSTLMTDLFAVPETRELEHLFEDLRSDRQHMAVVVDEHGGTAGVITLEDLLEEIVGEIDDEYDVAAEATRVEQLGSFVISAGLHPDEVAEATGFEMPDGPYETLAGFVLDRAGRIPRPGEIVTYDGWRIEVVAMARHRIMTVRVVAPPGGPS
ncbi:MAG: hemolysin family protein [Acidimicrobiia bacterium]|nr:hemolysin family protein [Acidimicrobiia bacterium]